MKFIFQGNRDEDQTVNVSAAQADAQALYEAGEKKWGTDETIFNQVMVTRSYAQLRQILQEYETLTGHTFETAIEREFSGSLKKALLAIGI